MPEAVIVAAVRSPIGRARKGSLAGLRPDDLAAGTVRAALDRVPELDPTTIDDVIVGCGLPGGEQGDNLGRIVPVLLVVGGPATSASPRSPGSSPPGSPGCPRRSWASARSRPPGRHSPAPG